MATTPVTYPINTTYQGNQAGQIGLPASAPINSIATTGSGSFVNVGTQQAPVWSNDPTLVALAQNAGSPQTSGITSSATMQNATDQETAVLNSIPGLTSAQQASNTQTGAAAQANIAAQGAQGDLQFSQEIQAAQSAENEALGNATVSGAETNPNAASMLANSTYTGLKSQLTNQFTQTIGNLVSAQTAYDQQVSANEGTSAAQTQANAITIANTAIQNQLSIMNSMVSQAQNSASLQLQQETASQNFQLGMANYNLQLQANNQNLAMGQLNTVLSQFSGTGGEGGWNALTPAQQNSINTMATAAGMPTSVIQGMINQSKATQFTTVSDPFGNATIVGMDSSGKEVSSQYVGGGFSPGTPMANATAQAMDTSYSDIGANFFTNTKYAPYSIAAGSKYLSSATATQFQGQYSAYTNLNQVASTLQDMSQLAKGSGDLVSDYPSRSLQELLQVDPDTTQNPGQFQADLATISSLDPTMFKAITSIQGLSGGIGLSALLNNAQGLLLNPNNTLQTNLQNVDNLQSQLENVMQATYGGGLSFPENDSTQTGGKNLFSSAINTGSNAGSTSSSPSGGAGSSWTSPSGQTYQIP